VFGHYLAARPQSLLTNIARDTMLSAMKPFDLVLETIASLSVEMYYYIGATHRGDQRFYGSKYREYRAVFVAGIDGPANEGLGPAETCSLEQFLQDKCKRTAYEKYDPQKRDLRYHPSLGASPTPRPIYSVYVAYGPAESQKNAPVRTRTVPMFTDADRDLGLQSQHVVQIRIGSQLHVDGPEYVGRAGSASHYKFIRAFSSFSEANRCLRDQLKTDPNLRHKLAPETVKNRERLLTALGITPANSPRRTAPYAKLFDFSICTIE
jgi:hypothetical protein